MAEAPDIPIPHLQRLGIKGFRSIREMDLELRPINVLIGANGAGKSNIIEIFNVINAIYTNRIREYFAINGGANRNLYFGKKITEQINIGLNLSSGTALNHSLIPTETDEFLRVGAFWVGDEEIMNQIPFLWRRYHFHDTGNNARLKQVSSLNGGENLQYDAGNLAAYLYYTKKLQPRYYRSIVSTVQRVAPFFHDFHLAPEPLNPETIRLLWQHRRSDEIFSAAALSDGTLRFICLATVLLNPEPPAVLIIDEPELGLHPYALELFAGLVRSASSRCQIILSTQSAALASLFSWEDIVVVDLIDDATVARHLAKEEVEAWLEDYSVGDLWRMNLIGGTP